MGEQAAPRSVGAFETVVEAFSRAWQHMVHLMFTGPEAGVRGWLVWGFLLMLSGATGGGFNFNVPSGVGDDGGGHRPEWARDLHRVDSFPEFLDWAMPYMALILLGIGLLVVFGLVVLYLQSRFRLVVLRCLWTGRAQLQGHFSATSRAGNSYFLFQLLFTVGSLVLVFAPLALIWLPLILGLGGHGAEGPIVVRVLLTLFWMVPIVLFLVVAEWFVYDLALVYLVNEDRGVLAAIGSAWRTTMRNFGSVLLFLIGRALVALAGAVVAFVVVCVTCCVWGLPAVLIVSLVMASIAAPILLWITIPLAIGLGLLMAWLISSLTAPIPVLYRGWSWSLLALIDPQIEPLGQVPHASETPPA